MCTGHSYLLACKIVRTPKTCTLHGNERLRAADNEAFVQCQAARLLSSLPSSTPIRMVGGYWRMLASKQYIEILFASFPAPTFYQWPD